MTTVLAAETWAEAPLRQFVADARVRIAVLMRSDGRVLSQTGLSSASDVMTACALAAAIHATAAELGRRLEGKPYPGLHVAGARRQIFLGAATTREGELLLLAVFDGSSSIGLVRVFFAELAERVATVEWPRDAVDVEQTLAADFEDDLNRNLAALFGRSAP